VAALARKLKTGWQYARDVIEVIQRRHKPIAQYFCADMGIRLMNIDSRISMGATGAMVAKGIHVLPVHDSWVVPARHIDQAEARIQEHFDRSSKSGSISSVNHCNIERKNRFSPHMSRADGSSLASSSSSPGSVPGGGVLLMVA